MLDAWLLPEGAPALADAAWFEAELGHAELGDARRTRRLVDLATALAARPTGSLPEACGTPARTKAAYRFFDLGETVSEGTVPDGIRAAHARATKARLGGQAVVLAVQDTTSLDYTAHPATADLGPLESPWRQGLFVHSTLAVSTDGVPQGLLAQQVWARDPEEAGSRHERKHRPTAEKESQKWLTALHESRWELPPGTTLVHVGDAEADVYDLFREAAALPDTELLVRATQDRRVAEPGRYLWEEVEARPVADTRQVELPRADERPARTATLTLRCGRVTLRPPKHRASEHLPELAVDAVLVREAGAPADQEPIEWLLLTTVAVPDVAAAWERVRWYTFRWRVERYHLVLKSGCQLEQRQLGTGGRLECCLALYSVVASRLLRLLYLTRQRPQAPATEVLTPEEWAVLWAARHPGRPRPTQPTVRQAVREIAGLGGFLGRRRDGEPGIITLWRGLHRLHDLLLGYYVARQLHSKDVGNA